MNEQVETPAGAVDAPAALAEWMRSQVGALAGPLRMTRFKGGQSNPTYLLSAGPQQWVLRKKPDGVLLAPHVPPPNTA